MNIETVQAWTANPGHSRHLKISDIEDFQAKFGNNLMLMQTRRGGFGVIGTDESTSAKLRAFISEHCPRLRSETGPINEIF